MSYRNDHDAALNRVAALEGELARLRGEKGKPEKQRVPESSGRYRLVGAMLGAFALICIGMVWRVTSAGAREVVDVDVEDPYDVVAPIVPMDEATCMAEIDARAVTDAAAADPRNTVRTPIASLFRSPIACRLSSSGRLKGELDNVTSLITVYYENDPVTADGYASAEQLWREYHRARARG